MNDIKSSKSLILENFQEKKDLERVNSFNRSNTLENNSKLRLDKFGNIISKKNRNEYKISFVDRVEKNKNLVEIHCVESYKQYNLAEERKGILYFYLY